MSGVFTGFFNQSELGRAYAIADCLVMPSDSGETWGLGVNEAMATRLPCLVSDAVGCGPDLIVRGKTGYTYPLGNVLAFSSALSSLRSQLRAGYSFAADCREHIAGYSFEKATEACYPHAGLLLRYRSRRQEHRPARLVAVAGPAGACAPAAAERDREGDEQCAELQARSRWPIWGQR